MKVTIPGHCYSKKNSRPIFRAGNRPFLGKSAKLRAYEERAAEILRAAWGNRPPCTSRCYIAASYYYAGQEPDALGFLETIFDCIEAAGIVEDDKQLVPAGNPAVTRIHVRKAEERVELELTPLLSAILEGASR